MPLQARKVGSSWQVEEPDGRIVKSAMSQQEAERMAQLSYAPRPGKRARGYMNVPYSYGGSEMVDVP
jgi:hypothetical protein